MILGPFCNRHVTALLFSKRLREKLDHSLRVTVHICSAIHNRHMCRITRDTCGPAVQFLNRTTFLCLAGVRTSGMKKSSGSS